MDGGLSYEVVNPERFSKEAALFWVIAVNWLVDGGFVYIVNFLNSLFWKPSNRHDDTAVGIETAGDSFGLITGFAS